MDHCDALGAEYEAKHLDFYLSDYFSNKVCNSHIRQEKLVR